jgi:hypothetical protein
MTAASPTARRPATRRTVAFCVQEAFAELQAEVERGAEVPFSLDTRRTETSSPALYAYRPLFRAYVAARAERLERLPAFRDAIAALAADPAVEAAARDHASAATTVEDAIRDAIVLPLIVGVAEGRGQFDFDDAVFDGIFDRMLAAVAQERRSYTAFLPLTGLRGPDAALDLSGGIVLRRVSPVELAEGWPECQGLLPERFTVGRDRLLGLELDVSSRRGDGNELPDGVRRFARAVHALRLVYGGPIAAGPCAFERVDWSPRAVRSMPAAVTAPLEGEPARVDSARLPLVRALVDRIADAEVRGGAIAVAVGRWATACGLVVPAERARAMAAAIEPLLGADGAGHYAVALRAAVLVGAGAGEREEALRAMRLAQRLAQPDAPLADLETLAARVGDITRGVLVAALDHGSDAEGLADTLDAVIIGSRPRPQVVSGLARSA